MYMTIPYEGSNGESRCLLGFKSLDLCSKFADTCEEDAIITVVNFNDFKKVGSLLKMPSIVILDNSLEEYDVMYIRDKVF